jgi:hypothetical protein
MSLELIIAILGNAITAGTILVAFVQIRRGDADKREVEIAKMARIEDRVETLWNFHIRRGMVEAVHKGVADMNSPIEMRDDSLKVVEGLREDLLDWYEKLGRPDITNRDLFIEIEKHFGDRLLFEVCKPYGFKEGTCILLCIAVIRGNNKIEFDLSSTRAEIQLVRPDLFESKIVEPPKTK